VAWCAFLSHLGWNAARIARWASDPAGVLVTADAAGRPRHRSARDRPGKVPYRHLRLIISIYDDLRNLDLGAVSRTEWRTSLGAGSAPGRKQAGRSRPGQSRSGQGRAGQSRPEREVGLSRAAQGRAPRAERPGQSRPEREVGLSGAGLDVPGLRATGLARCGWEPRLWAQPGGRTAVGAMGAMGGTLRNRAPARRAVGPVHGPPRGRVTVPAAEHGFMDMTYMSAFGNMTSASANGLRVQRDRDA
jgi:hypothetical protein